MWQTNIGECNLQLSNLFWFKFSKPNSVCFFCQTYKIVVIIIIIIIIIVKVQPRSENKKYFGRWLSNVAKASAHTINCQFSNVLCHCKLWSDTLFDWCPMWHKFAYQTFFYQYWMKPENKQKLLKRKYRLHEIKIL